MNMPMPILLPLQLSQSQHLNVPPVLRHALICCMAALVGALLLWLLSAVWHGEAETARNDVSASTQKTATQLADAREAGLARTARAQRFTLVKTVLESNFPEKTEREQIIGQLSAHPYIVEPVLTAQPGQPAFSSHGNLPVIILRHLYVEAGLLHEEALLALNAIATSSSAHVIPTGCSLHREADAAPVTLRARCEFDRITLAASPGSMQ
ncbi:MAG: hypothetical protein LBP99_08875 [Azoarcus sp.]|jgi:hypothetical protein|nr:hypothetical protein [Azoarcus sp.]